MHVGRYCIERHDQVHWAEVVGGNIPTSFNHNVPKAIDVCSKRGCYESISELDAKSSDPKVSKQVIHCLSDNLRIQNHTYFGFFVAWVELLCLNMYPAWMNIRILSQILDLSAACSFINFIVQALYNPPRPRIRYVTSASGILETDLPKDIGVPELLYCQRTASEEMVQYTWKHE